LRIGIIWKNEYPWDVRVEKIARALQSAGHVVYVLAANTKGRPGRESMDGLEIRRLPATPLRWLNALIGVPFYLNPFWFRHATRVAREERLDLVIVRDLPLILVGVWLKKRCRVPLLLDMAEDYPAMYRESLDLGGWRAWIYRVVKNPSLMALVERRTLPRVDHTLVVVEESARRLEQQLSVPPARVSVVSNTPDVSAMEPPLANDARSSRGPLMLVYTGFVQEARGLEVVVDALARLRARKTDVRFRVVGDGPYLSRLVRRVELRGLRDAVEFTGWVPHAEVARHVRDADVGVIPHPKNDHTDTTIPNKLFDYMACGKPVVVSNAAPMERIVRSEHCGLVFTAGSPESLAEVVERLAADPSALAGMGRNGAEAVRQRFHWGRDARVLRDAVARFA
jgi:glycosyltransferase involved in cell wall biosynthesis